MGSGVGVGVVERVGVCALLHAHLAGEVLDDKLAGRARQSRRFESRVILGAAADRAAKARIRATLAEEALLFEEREHALGPLE